MRSAWLFGVIKHNSHSLPNQTWLGKVDSALRAGLFFFFLFFNDGFVLHIAKL